ncbi:MAG TPA: Ku protein [Gemmatimonadales bacterium]|jgi:DNA end-binding protein Ku|nr:Ku protein [Gemmatimonadales bacterium]
MPAHALGSATISFGLVSVPIKLFSTSESKASVSFNWLHAKCGSRLKQQYWCPKDEETVARDEMVKGYEFSKGQFVTFTPEELKALDEKATNSIDINEFVPLAAIDRIYLERAYFLGPDKGGERAYKLLLEAMKETGRAALGQYAVRGQQYLALIRPMDDHLVMEQLHYADELKSAAEVEVPDTKVKPAELTLAKQLIEQTSTDEFRPEQYQDTVRGRVMEAIQRKVEGQDITEEPAEAPQAKIIDIMEALKASLARAGSEEAGPKPAKAAREQPAKGKKRMKA